MTGKASRMGAPGRQGSPRQRNKLLLKALLGARDLAGLDRWAGRTENAGAILLSLLLYETDELLRWRAIEGLGRLAAGAGKDPQGWRELLRRLLWSMNDESGGVGWHAPEAMGEILAAAPHLAPEYAPLLTSLLGEEPFRRGAHWAVARAAAVEASPFGESVPALEAAIGDPDPFIRGHALIGLLALGAPRVEEHLRRLREDPGVLRTYDRQEGRLKEVTVASLAQGPATGRGG